MSFLLIHPSREGGIGQGSSALSAGCKARSDSAASYHDERQDYQTMTCASDPAVIVFGRDQIWELFTENPFVSPFIEFLTGLTNR